jgi:hypothetical protein
MNFFKARQEHFKGPNNIIDVWKKFNIGEVPSDNLTTTKWDRCM